MAVVGSDPRLILPPTAWSPASLVRPAAVAALVAVIYVATATAATIVGALVGSPDTSADLEPVVLGGLVMTGAALVLLIAVVNDRLTKWGAR